MANVTVSPGVPLPLVPPSGPVEPSLAAPAPVTASRIAGYDFARALAVLGMIVVNYYSIFRTSLKEPLPFTTLAEFLCGRAAVLFVMLAGVGVTLLARRPLSSGIVEAMDRYRLQMVKRCAVLLVMGCLFRLVWNADILHFYALFLCLGALCVTLPNRRLWFAIAIIWLTATMVYTATLSDPGLPEQSSLPVLAAGVMDDLLLGGYYAAFPWFAFLLVGIWFGRPEVMSRPERHGRIFVVALALFVVAELLMAYGPEACSPSDSDGSPLASLFDNNAFPASPLFALSAAANAMMVLVAAIHLGCRPVCSFWGEGLQSAGKCSLTVYIGHVLVGLALVQPLKGVCDQVVYPYMVTLFMLAVMVGQILFARAWFRRHQLGPLEWLLRRCSGSG